MEGPSFVEGDRHVAASSVEPARALRHRLRARRQRLLLGHRSLHDLPRPLEPTHFAGVSGRARLRLVSDEFDRPTVLRRIHRPARPVVVLTGSADLDDDGTLDRGDALVAWV